MIPLYRAAFFTALSAITVLAVIPDYSCLPSAVSISDLLNHSIAFSVLTLLYRLSFSHTWKRILASLFAYALLIELVQAFLPTRCASIEDVVADSVGMVIGLIVSRQIVKSVPTRDDRD
ncbi:VanZ family protein [Sulfuricurvum sp.]|uniref:VanZ family protein n=1 Tax=Sulfuricurvum sp. TaxID=2025608 RepID=UPI003BAE5AF7